MDTRLTEPVSTLSPSNVVGAASFHTRLIDEQIGLEAAGAAHHDELARQERARMAEIAARKVMVEQRAKAQAEARHAQAH